MLNKNQYETLYQESENSVIMLDNLNRSVSSISMYTQQIDEISDY